MSGLGMAAKKRDNIKPAFANGLWNKVFQWFWLESRQ